jgi:thioredoxin reductase (NADPH)
MGGQLSGTHRIENFPGFPNGIEGAKLAQRFRLQAKRFGAEMVHDAATEVDFSNSRLAVRTRRRVTRVAR